LADPETKPRDSGEKSEPKKKKPKKNKTRELVECLLVAGVLALGIRSFAFQIFKIPTRSMEPTLIGNEDYGDRVVAAMWYRRGGFPHLTLARPDRWQVIVFDHYIVQDGEKKRTNFIKRLIGLPGERLEIRDGDIWVQKPGKKEAELERKPTCVQEQLWTKLCDLDLSEWWKLKYYWESDSPIPEPAGPSPVAATSGWRFENGALVGTSSVAAEARLHWTRARPIDNRMIRPTVRLIPGDVPKEKRYLLPCKHRFRAIFDTARPIAFCPQCHKPVYGVPDRTADETGMEEGLAIDRSDCGILIRDTNSTRPNSDYWSESGNAPEVPDLRLGLEFESLGGAGDLEIALTGRSETFVCTLPLGRPGAKAAFSGQRLGPPIQADFSLGAGPHRLEVMNVDGSFRAELDGKGIGRPIEYSPNDRPGNSDASIKLTGGARIAIRHLSLSRDIYYGFSGSKMTPFDPVSNAAVAREFDEYGKLKVANHASFIKMPDDGYFFLGDNQLASADSREFDEPKRGKDLVARGIFVAWPPSRFHLVW
jgi:signal peptidase I